MISATALGAQFRNRRVAIQPRNRRGRQSEGRDFQGLGGLSPGRSKSGALSIYRRVFPGVRRTGLSSIIVLPANAPSPAQRGRSARAEKRLRVLNSRGMLVASVQDVIIELGFDYHRSYGMYFDSLNDPLALKQSSQANRRKRLHRPKQSDSPVARSARDFTRRARTLTVPADVCARGNA